MRCQTTDASFTSLTRVYLPVQINGASLLNILTATRHERRNPSGAERPYFPEIVTTSFPCLSVTYLARARLGRAVNAATTTSSLMRELTFSSWNRSSHRDTYHRITRRFPPTDYYRDSLSQTRTRTLKRTDHFASTRQKCTSLVRNWLDDVSLHYCPSWDSRLSRTVA